MLTSLKIARFKSLVDVTIELGRVNLFIGANGSGKSNVLEALGVLSAAASGRVDDQSLSRRGVRPGTEEHYKSAFPKLPNVPHIALSAFADNSDYTVTLWNPAGTPGAPWRFKSEQLTGNGNKIVGRSPTSLEAPNQEQGMAALKTVELEASNPALLLMNQLRDFAIHDPNTPALRGQGMGLRMEPVCLDGEGLAEAIQGVPKDATDEALDLIDWAAAIDVVTTHGVSPASAELVFDDRFMAEGRNRLTARDASEGALYVLFYLVLAEHPKAPRCLAVDNFGQALNPRLAAKLTSAVCDWTDRQNGCQWLLTAHNPAVLDGLPLQDPGVRLFTVDRSSLGHTIVRRMDLQEAIKKRPGDEWTLSRMWMNGLLGAVPSV